MQFLAESALHLTGFAVGVAVGLASYSGFRGTASPTLFRLSAAFFLIGAGFLLAWAGGLLPPGDPAGRGVAALGTAAQTAGYFFIAFSHGIKSFFPKNARLRSAAPLPLFLAPAAGAESLLRSASFVLLAYASVETILSYAASRKASAAVVASGLAMLALGEFLGWYALVIPGQAVYYASVSSKISGLAMLSVPVWSARLRGPR